MGLLKYLADTQNEIYLVEFFSQVFPLMENIVDEEGQCNNSQKCLCRFLQAERFGKLKCLKEIAPQWHRLIKELSDRVDFTTVKELAVSIIRGFELGSRFQDKGNLMKFIELTDGITQQGRNGRIGLQAFLDEAERYGNAVPLAADAEPDAIQVLTVHKAKGLEFEAVILPQVNEPFRFDKKRSNFMMPYNENFHLEDIHLTPSKQELGFSSELDRIYAIETENAHLDALNLLYVALTRPKTALFIITPVITGQKKKPKKDTGKDAISWLSIMSGALSIDESLLETDQNTVLYTSGDTASLKRDASNAKGPKDSKKSEVSGKSIKTRGFAQDNHDEFPACQEKPDLENLEKQGTHADSFKDEKAEAREVSATPGDLLARKYGEAFHFAAEHLLPRMDIKHACAVALARYGYLLDDQHRKRLRTDLGNLAANPVLTDLFSKGRVLTELPLLDRKKTAAKFVDAVVALDNEIVVIDYKTRFRKEAMEGYRKQVLNYMELLDKLYPLRSVRGMLVFVDAGIRIELVERENVTVNRKQ